MRSLLEPQKSPESPITMWKKHSSWLATLFSESLHRRVQEGRPASCYAMQPFEVERGSFGSLPAACCKVASEISPISVALWRFVKYKSHLFWFGTPWSSWITMNIMIVSIYIYICISVSYIYIFIYITSIHLYVLYLHQKLVRAFCVNSNQESTVPVPAKSLNNTLLSIVKK